MACCAFKYFYSILFIHKFADPFLFLTVIFFQRRESVLDVGFLPIITPHSLTRTPNHNNVSYILKLKYVETYRVMAINHIKDDFILHYITL